MDHLQVVDSVVILEVIVLADHLLSVMLFNVVNALVATLVDSVIVVSIAACYYLFISYITLNDVEGGESGGSSGGYRSSRPSGGGSGVCYAFQRGECTRGDTCRFSHSVDDANTQ